MHAENKHSYLQSRTTINPRIITRSVALARGNQTVDQFDGQPVLNRITSMQPRIPVYNFDVTRRPLAFGRWALPKLKKELHSDDPDVQMAAILTIQDLVHDPERNYEAIKLRIPDRLSDLLLHKDAAIRKCVVLVLTTMAGLMEGKIAIVSNKKTLKKLSRLLEDVNIAVRYDTILLIERIACLWKAADILVDFGFIKILIDQIIAGDRNCLSHYLAALESLMYCTGKEIAIELELFYILLNLLEQENETTIVANVLKNLSVLMQTSDGKEYALKSKLLKTLIVLLHDERPAIYENAARAMVLATIKSEAIVKALKLPQLLERLLILASNQHEPIAQRYCLQVITNLVQQKDAKKVFLEKNLKKLESIYVGHDDLTKALKERLLTDVLTFY